MKAYIFALFNEDLKPGPTSERNFGLFKPDGSVAYHIGFTGINSAPQKCSPSRQLELKGGLGAPTCLSSQFVQPLYF
ncbi:Glucan endo-1 3-beta-glucosidase 11 [Bienertia sinuspersici]